MNILISQTYDRWTADDIEHGDTDDKGFHFQDVPHTFREIVELLQTHTEPSNYPMQPAYAADTWFTCNDAIESIEQGITENTAIHFSRDNDARALRYWRLAIRFAGIK